MEKQTIGKFKKIAERGKFDTPKTQYMTAHFPGLFQVLQ